MEKIIWEVPIRTVSEANVSEHWTKKSRRHKQQQFFVRCLFMKETRKISLPCSINIVRISPKFLDCEDNLPMSLKWIKDEIGACLFPEKIITYYTKDGKVKQNKGHADSDKNVRWTFSQEKNNRYGIRIEVECLTDH